MQIKTYTQIVDSLISGVGSRTPLSNFNVGGKIRTILEVVSEATAELYMFGAEELANVFLSTASGVWLDRKGAEYNLVRHQSIKAQGTVVFGRNVARNTNIPIPAGTVVATRRDGYGVEYRYKTDAQVILAAGTTTIEAAVTADWPTETEKNGSLWNAAGAGITAMKTYLSGVDYVTNASDWLTTAGADEESDAHFRRRIKAKWNELARGGTAAAYESLALSVAGVESAFVDDNLPRGEGTVDIYIMSQGGAPSQALIDDVQDVIDANRPITADALVRAPQAVTVAVTMQVTPKSGADITVLDAEIKRRLRVYFGSIVDAALDVVPLGVGKDVCSARLAAIAMSVPGVYKAVMITPTADVIVDPNEYPTLGTPIINFGAYSNE